MIGTLDTSSQADRILIIGLDGGTWSVLDRFIELGRMPFLAGLARTGYRADLRSTDPPITPVAWSSFATGMNPGKHGVFGFLSLAKEPGSYFPPPARRQDVRAPSLWRRVSDAGLRTIVLSVPLTYPPEHVNGCVVSGMFTPASAPDATFPRPLTADLEGLGIMPVFNPSFSFGSGRRRRAETFRRLLSGEAADEYFWSLNDATERLRKTALHLGEEPWDLMVAVFIGTDRIQHSLWDEIERLEPDSALGRRICDFYESIDRAIADLVESAGPDAVTVIMSDHGFGRCAGQFSVTGWLVEQGYACYRPRRLYDAARRFAHVTGADAIAARLIARGGRVSKSVRHSFVPLEWSRTRAYFQAGTYGLRLNLRGRETSGIVEPGPDQERLLSELRERVLEMRDPVSGEHPIEDAVLPEEIYSGEQRAWAPDIILRPNAALGYHLVSRMPGRRVSLRSDPTSRGSHRPNGILLLSGGGVKGLSSAPERSICDIAPTALWLLGLPVPPDMDGTMIGDAFLAAPHLLRRRAERSAPPSGEAEPDTYTERERDEIEERLRGLGYID